MKTIKELRIAIQDERERSAWGKAVKEYALDILADYGEDEKIHGSPADVKRLLNGADTWSQSSWGGCYLIYDFDIAVRVCNPSELKRTRKGELRPNSGEEWLDVQARALGQAEMMIRRLAKMEGVELITHDAAYRAIIGKLEAAMQVKK